MKILIVSTYFPPENSIASLRPYSWAKWWSRAGHDVTVLTTPKNKRENSLNLDCSMFKVIEIPVPVLNKIQSSKIASSVRENKINPQSQERKTLMQKLFIKLKKIYNSFSNKTGCFSTCRFPDWNDLWIKKVVKEVINSGNCNWDILITTGGPYSVHRIGLVLKKKGSVKKWIVDWRDLWTKNHLFNGVKIFHPYERWLENQFHQKADLITTVSDGAADVLLSMTNTPVKVIFNGFDQDDFNFLYKKERTINEKFTIAYLGTLYKKFQNPNPLLEAVHSLHQEGKITSSDFQIIFAGPNSDIIERVKELGIEAYYNYRGFLPREEALQLQYDADAVLFLEYTNPNVKGVLTGKLFEYLYIARCIWAVGVSSETDAGELIERANAGICLWCDVEQIKEHILFSISQKKAGVIGNRDKNLELISQFDRKKQAELLLEYVF